MYQCTHCSKSFDHLGHFKEHQKVHSNVREHHCDVCQKSFKRLSHLKDHKKTHEPKAFQCHICSKAFTYKSNLTQHLKRHEGKVVRKRKTTVSTKMVLCSVCMLKIPIKDIDEHMKIHSAAEPNARPSQVSKKSTVVHSCPFDGCGKIYSTKYNLKCHMDAVHLELRPYSCHICKSSFGFRSALIRHMKTHTLFVQCPFCQCHFESLPSLKEHMAVHSKQSPEDVLLDWYGAEETLEICD